MGEVEVILGNSNKRFSGVTSTMLATLPGVAAECEVAILGGHYVPDGYRVIGFWEMVKMCQKPLPSGKPRVFHARRNDEMIQALAARALGAKLRIIFTSTAQRNHSGFTKRLMSRMDGILTTCDAAAGYLDHAPDAIIPHGVDLEEFAPADDRDGLWESLGHGGQIGIGAFGRVRPSKGTDLLVRAAIPVLQQDPRPTVVIIGETTPKFQPFQDELQAEIDAAGLTDRILFLGKLPFADVKEHFRAVSIVAALSRNEGFGLTVLEAMASGAAVIATKAGAWEELLSHQPESLVPDFSSPSVQSTLQKKLDSDLPTDGHRNHQYITENYSIQQEVDALLSFYFTDSKA